MTTAFIPPAVSGGGITNPGGGLGSMADGTGAGGTGVDAGVGLLAMTGAGPGTFLLALAGLVSLVAGGVMTLSGRKMTTRNSIDGGLPDLSHLSHNQS